jgi:hypothetical protein
MQTIVLLSRVWGLRSALLLAGIEGLASLYWWRGGTPVPTIERNIPMPALLPAVLVISLTFVLIERWPEQMCTSARALTRIRLARYGACLVVALIPAYAASMRGLDHETASLTAVGLGLAGVLAPVLGCWTWMPLMLLGYGWLQYAAHNVTGDYLTHDVLLAWGSVIAGGGAYALGMPAAWGEASARLHRPSRKPSRQLG